MYIITDNRIPDEAKINLRAYGELIEVPQNDVVYTAISSHPDIFIFQDRDKLIVAPNSPASLISELKNRNIKFEFGEVSLGKKYPQTAHYNIAFNDGLMIHKKGITDEKLIEKTKPDEFVNVNQAYSRCTTLILKKDRIITSDSGINKALPQSFFIDDSNIILPGFDHGFFGGCCGVFENKLFVMGEIDTLPNSIELKKYIKESGFEIIELNKGCLFDGGGLFFISNLILT